MSRIELHIFSDALEKAIAAVAYEVVALDNDKYVGFVCDKAKVAPTSGHTIPRLELCGTVLAVELSETVFEQLGQEITDTTFLHRQSSHSGLHQQPVETFLHVREQHSAKDQEL